jgi:hypothetical protein
MHPFLNLATSRPQLLLHHAAAYAELAQAELGGVAARVKKQAVLGVVGGVLLVVALVLAGVALMLCALLYVAPNPALATAHTGWVFWVMWLVPGAPAVGAAICALAMRQSAADRNSALDGLQSQWRADVALWQEMSAK